MTGADCSAPADLSHTRDSAATSLDQFVQSRQNVLNLTTISIVGVNVRPCNNTISAHNVGRRHGD